jgi:hypothetical protein
MGEEVEFLHQLFMEFFAAAYLDSQLRGDKSYNDVLSKLFFNNQWDEVIEMLAAITERPAELVLWLNKQAEIKQQWHAAVLAKRCLVASDALSDPHACVSVLRAPTIAPELSSETDEIEYIPDEIFESLGAMCDERAVIPFFQLLRFKLIKKMMVILMAFISVHLMNATHSHNLPTHRLLAL